MSHKGLWTAQSLSHKGQLFRQLEIHGGLFQGCGGPLECLLQLNRDANELPSPHHQKYIFVNLAK